MVVGPSNYEREGGMKKSEIVAGKTYVSKGPRKTTRTVIEVSDNCRPGISYFTDGDTPEEPGVLFIDSKGIKGRLYLTSFASWAGGVE